MKSLLSKILIGAAGLVLAVAPLAASAQDWHGQHNDRGSYRSNDNRGHDNRRDDRTRDYHTNRDYRDVRYRGYANGYYGRAPGGFQGYYSNGNWYHHRRWNGGIWVYF